MSIQDNVRFGRPFRCPSIRWEEAGDGKRLGLVARAAVHCVTARSSLEKFNQDIKQIEIPDEHEREARKRGRLMMENAFTD